MKKKNEPDSPLDMIDVDEAIDIVIDGVMLGSKMLRRASKKILKAQRKLRKLVDDDAWAAFMKIEELWNERADKEAHVLVRWALGHGARSRR